MRIALTDMVIGGIIGNAKINCGILPNPRYRGPHSRSVAVVGARRGARQEANRGPRARCSKAFSAGSMTPTTPFRLNACGGILGRSLSAELACGPTFQVERCGNLSVSTSVLRAWVSLDRQRLARRSQSLALVKERCEDLKARLDGGDQPEELHPG